jgi:SAM-dependent methyltransferase
MSASLVERNCPVCGESPERGTLYADCSFDTSKLTGFSYASRKIPEFMCYRLIKCGKCRVIFAAATPDTGQLHKAYDNSLFDSAKEAEDAADSYVRILSPQLKKLPDRRAVLEVGAGTGVFLEKIRFAGFEQLVGIEPSQSAINAASHTIRQHMRHGMFRGEDFADQSFSLICCFMTMEHVPEPLEFVRHCHRLLIPGGMLALVTHNYTSLVNRLLGRRSPIIDIEHLQLFHPHSLRVLLSSSSFSDIRILKFMNTYRAAYWLRLLPMPHWLQSSVITPLANTRFGEFRITANVGNIMMIGQRDSAIQSI